MPDTGTKVLFIAGFGPIDRDVPKSRALYADSLGIPFKQDAGGYLYTGALEGAKHFALWPLSQAAQSCFGTDSWPDNLPVPQAWLEFEVDNVEKATADLESRISNAHPKQDRTLGPNRKPLPLPRGPSRRRDVYSGAAGREIIRASGTIPGNVPSVPSFPVFHKNLLI